MSEKYRTHYSELVRQSRYMYWQALLTINGIILSVFSAIYLLSAVNNRFFILLLVLTSILSCWLIVWNFLKIKELYEQIFEDFENIKEMTEEDLKIITQERTSQSSAIKRIEYIVQSLLFVETAILLLILFR